ncbi:MULTISPECIES: KH domain-containing protein [Psychrilyobacter]|uniref:RNA-binding protein KhpA n=1 Tax=Psychrilyobacter piezotolerans TaxID=2293438 RepID=A0ABX9KHF7_9FUSO|nr:MULTISPECIES: KH domain-containing protein [Psychrilyobacter]UUV17988.1 KH domain-containing protein [Fusobacteria bacterium ZRK30]MCS5421465.1 KH domain-containing protein [Psychrilyobacter sp. S5]NDI77783.1 KH domain-containing protein [Psychrilyobacter piezotolerans]RDE62363.1 KH domain-containing protein [Psychrilyobacter sp. S5]REI41461.1 KH domain-containing protein [Psychrilyobacter piezotolerans]
MEKLEALLKYIVSEMVKTQDAIDITYEEKKDLIVFKIRVADGELGKVIGKNGLTANAIRGVMQAAAVKDKLNVNVEFLD